MNSPARVVVVVGHPKGGSRTSASARTIAELAATRLFGSAEVVVIELADLAGVLHQWGDADVASAKRVVLEADVLFVVSPVFKASFTGLLKSFLDQFGQDELAAVPTVPLMIGGSADHRLAMETQLRPVLVEIGASCPTRGIYLIDTQLDDVDVQFDRWWAVWGVALRRGFDHAAP